MAISPSFRKRNYKNIVDEMQFLKEKYSITDIIFYDDCFFYNLQTVHRDIFDFCSMLTNNALTCVVIHGPIPTKLGL